MHSYANPADKYRASFDTPHLTARKPAELYSFWPELASILFVLAPIKYLEVRAWNIFCESYAYQALKCLMDPISSLSKQCAALDNTVTARRIRSSD